MSACVFNWSTLQTTGSIWRSGQTVQDPDWTEGAERALTHTHTHAVMFTLTHTHTSNHAHTYTHMRTMRKKMELHKWGVDECECGFVVCVGEWKREREKRKKIYLHLGLSFINLANFPTFEWGDEPKDVAVAIWWHTRWDENLETPLKLIPDLFSNTCVSVRTRTVTVARCCLKRTTKVILWSGAVSQSFIINSFHYQLLTYGSQMLFHAWETGSIIPFETHLSITTAIREAGDINQHDGDDDDDDDGDDEVIRM